MDSRRFDALAKTLGAAPQSRRTALRRLTGGLGAALGAAVLLPRRGRTQDATPAASPAAGTLTEFLYIQSFASGTLRPKEGEDGVHELVLLGGTGQTLYFADRPERQVGGAPTERVLAAIGFDPENPPNAGLVAHTDDGERVIILELMNPRFDQAVESLTYDVRPLADYDGAGLSHLAAKHSDEELPEAFAAASLFIDGGGCPYPICGGICCDASQGMVCQGQGAYCQSIYQSGMCQGGNACDQRPHTTCNAAGTCYCGTDIEGGGACVNGVQNICSRSTCSTSSDCAYGKLCFNAPCCGSQVCLPLCQA
ncbi:MAG: hypothetical protein M3464_13205 [Chloroflexota bacterium]|nr:hypothetical protein [Chloroflexota bacterium]